MSQPERTAGGLAPPAEGPPRLTMPLPSSNRTIAQLAHVVEIERRIHLADLALGLGGGPKQAMRTASSGNDLDQAVVKLLEKLRAEGLA